MSVATPAKFSELLDAESLFRLSVTQYQELIDAEIIDSEEPVELLEGLLVRKMTKYQPHVYTVMLLRMRLEQLLPSNFHVRTEAPILLKDGQPEPDVSIARGSMLDYLVKIPTLGDVPLVIEVADSSLVRDRGIKLRSYARAGIPAYWIVNLVERTLEVHTDPQPTAEPSPTYGRRQVFSGESAVELLIDGQTIATVTAAELLPPIQTK